MIVSNERCRVCGRIADFTISDDAVLLREAKCNRCGASLRNSDVAGEVIRFISGRDAGLVNQLDQLEKYKILNACSSGYIHNALKDSANYICSEFFDEVKNGEYYEGVLCVDLCNIPFEDGIFDIIITEDVFEHITDYGKAMTEIHRVLKPGGCHIFTVPLHDGQKTVSRQGKRNVYHGDPLHADEGSLVITDWGNDIQEIVENYGYRVEIVRKHAFYSPEEVTVVDESYDEYLAKRECLENYLKYNSTIIVAYKEITESREVDDRKQYSAEQLLDRYQKLNDVVIALNRSIRNKNDTIRQINDDNEQRGILITELNGQIEEKNSLISKLQKENSDRNAHITELDSELEEKGEIIRGLQAENADRNRHIAHLDIVVEQNRQVIEKQKQASDSQLDQIVRLSDLIVQQTARIMEQTERLEENAAQGRRHLECIDQLSLTIRQKDEEISNYCRREQEYEQRMAEIKQSADGEKREYERKMAEIKQSADEARAGYEQRMAEIAQSADEERQEYEQKMAEMRQTILNKEGHIELLLESERAYERDQKTHSYRLCKKMQKAGNIILPPDSRRRFFLRITYNVLRHPVLMAHVINPKRIKNYIKYMKLEGMEGVKKRYEETVDIERMQVCPGNGLELDLEEVRETAGAGQQSIEEFEKITFPQFVNPRVSIIIPVYNAFHYTYGCLRSILRNSGDISYEVIIANDCSTDLTNGITKIVENINVVTTKENLRFLRNCNNAAGYARGEYILFLNNDTQVQNNWLEPLVDLIESDGKIGMVGSKLVYPDGKLQEAGGILWKDGSAWNYGNGRNPEDPEFNYVKEADYISGAAVMIRRTLWNEIGGFDERFAPAYCEDSDLAFEVRKRGYKVMYQPLSVVVHFEGISNGTSTDSGLKAYQVVNQQKFTDKWKDTLEGEHFPNAEKVFVARDRSRGKKVLVMVDHYVPQYDKDAGSRTVFQYLRMFVHKGYNVKFIGDNFYRHEPYTTTLQQMGIEVLYGPYYANNWKEWIVTNREFITHVFLNRPHIAVNYIDFIKANTSARVIYYGHDLHFLREMRKYELTGEKKALSDSRDWKEKELYLMRKADAVYYPSCVEVDEIAKIDGSVGAKAIVAYIFDNVVSERYLFGQRKDIMFVGGFTHTPNVDAVLWFAREILPRVNRALPDLKLYIMGSNPPLEIQKLEGTNIVVKGFVTDDVLQQFYRTCRLSIVPLRYGAGIKGKVIEAMRYGMPVMTTAVGAEGIEGAGTILAIEDDAGRFAEQLVNLYNDRYRLEKMSENSYQYICSNFSEENAWRMIEKDFT